MACFEVFVGNSERVCYLEGKILIQFSYNVKEKVFKCGVLNMYVVRRPHGVARIMHSKSCRGKI